jgi:hypothetical protein
MDVQNEANPRPSNFGRTKPTVQLLLAKRSQCGGQNEANIIASTMQNEPNQPAHPCKTTPS